MDGEMKERGEHDRCTFWFKNPSKTIALVFK